MILVLLGSMSAYYLGMMYENRIDLLEQEKDRAKTHIIGLRSRIKALEYNAGIVHADTTAAED